MKRLFKTSHTQRETYKGRHRFEHWYRDNSVYFITASVRGHDAAFASDSAKRIFWDRFDHYTTKYQFIPWITSLLPNHYHTIGYIKAAKPFGQMMRHLHGSVAKQVNDVLPARHLPFWRDRSGKDYFDGCLRDESQCRLAYRYTLMQSVRHGCATDWRAYAHTRIKIDLDRGVKRALELRAFMEGVPYKRYDG